MNPSGCADELLHMSRLHKTSASFQQGTVAHVWCSLQRHLRFNSGSLKLLHCDKVVVGTGLISHLILVLLALEEAEERRGSGGL